MTVSSRLALAMVVLVVATSCVVSAFAWYFIAERGAARGVDGDRQRGAGRWRGLRRCSRSLLPPESRNVLRKPPPAATAPADCAWSPEPEQERRYQALAIDEKMAQAIIEEALDAFVQTDGCCVVLNWSPHAEALMGWTREEAVGRERGGTGLSGIAASRCTGSGSTGS